VGPPRLDLVSLEEGHHDQQQDREIGAAAEGTERGLIGLFPPRRPYLRW
jgi:Zn ribbon nucleic-acid-binding protein